MVREWIDRAGGILCLRVILLQMFVFAVVAVGQDDAVRGSTLFSVPPVLGCRVSFKVRPVLPQSVGEAVGKAIRRDD